jgi:multiple sugar transport system substrate-binding protein
VTSSGLSRREFIKAGGACVTAAALLGGLSACPSRSSGKGGEQRLTFTMGKDASGTLQPLIDRFNEANKGRIQVSLREMSPESDAYYRQLESDFKAGSAEMDVIGADVVWTAALAQRGWVVDLSSRFFDAFRPEDFLDPSMSSVFYKFKVWGLPWFTVAGMLFYRRDLLERAGLKEPPNQWTQLREMVTRVREIEKVEQGFVFQGAEYEGGVVNAAEFIWNAGGRISTSNLSVAAGRGQSVMDPDIVTIDSPQAAAGLDAARAVVADGITPGDVTSYREAESLEAFRSGKALFLRHWPEAYRLIQGEGSQISADQVGVAHLPGAASTTRRYGCLGGWNLMINARSSKPKQEAAWTFIRFLVDAAQQRERASRGGFLPTLRSLHDDPELTRALPIMSLGREATARARTRPLSPYYMQMSPRIAQAFHRVLAGELSGGDAARKLDAELRGILRANR